MSLDLSAILRGEDTDTAVVDENHIIDIFDGRVINKTDVDSLVDAYEQAKEASDRLTAWQRQLRELISLLADGDAKTQRVRGKRRIAKIEKPAESWDQSILKEAWNAYPLLRDELLKISSVGVKKREFGKAIKTNGPDDFNTFVGMIQSAERPPSGLPTITIET